MLAMFYPRHDEIRNSKSFGPLLVSRWFFLYAPPILTGSDGDSLLVLRDGSFKTRFFKGAYHSPCIIFL